MSLVCPIVLLAAKRLQEFATDHPPAGIPPPGDDGMPGPPLVPPLYNAYTFTYGQFDPSRLQYGTTPPVFHIVAAVDDHEPFELGVEYEIEIRRKRP